MVCRQTCCPKGPSHHLYVIAPAMYNKRPSVTVIEIVIAFAAKSIQPHTNPFQPYISHQHVNEPYSESRFMRLVRGLLSPACQTASSGKLSMSDGQR